MRRRRLSIVVVGLALAAIVVAPAGVGASDRTDVKVMVRNLYLGADLVPLITAPTQEEFEERATRTFRRVKRTDFPARSKLIAREIDRKNPDLVGLQEVATWRTGPKDGDETRAKRVVFDFLALMKEALDDRGERYRVVQVQREADLEAPTSAGKDVRLTMHDVILARRGAGVDIVGRRDRNYDQNLTVPTVNGPAESTRGWTSADVKMDGDRFRFVNTHLEAFSAGVRAVQAEELTERRGALRTSKPTILVGDLNSDPEDTPDEAAAYEVFRQDGFRDAWLRTQDSRGLTCCFSADLMDPEPDFSLRIDHVLFRNGVSAERTRRFGIDPGNRTGSGLWPSDHGGVAASLEVR